MYLVPKYTFFLTNAGSPVICLCMRASACDDVWLTPMLLALTSIETIIDYNQ